MDTPINTLMVEGSFEDQIVEMAQYIDTRKGATGFAAEVEQQLEKGEREEALKAIVDASVALASAPEREYIPAYNLLINLIRGSENLATLLPTILQNLSAPPPNTQNGPFLCIHALSTIFNILPASSELRYSVFRTILKLISTYNLYDALSPQLKHLEKWVSEWNCSLSDIRELYMVIAEISKEAVDHDQFYNTLFKALQTFPPNEASTPQAREIAIRLVKAAINIPARLEFDDIIALDAVQALSTSDPEAFGLLEIFASGELEDYEEFNDEHDGWVDNNGIDHSTAFRKSRLLTLASLAASAPNRELPYPVIQRRLHIPSEEVELWVIDVIRAGLVEGRLSQLNQTFLIHRSIYRSFGKEEWQEVGQRLETWKESLRGILEVVRSAREQVEAQNTKEKTHAQIQAEKAERNALRLLEVEG